MKELIFVVMVAGGIYYFWSHHQHAQATEASKPLEIKDPIYSEVHVNLSYHGKSIEAVVLAKTANQAECDKYSTEILKYLPASSQQGLHWTMLSSECKPVLDSRKEKLFDNKPSYVAYISASPGNKMERELRWIYWGMTADESEKICGFVKEMQQGWTGTVQCIHHMPT